MTGVAGPRLPKTLRVEAKFTTGTLITIPKREREALIGHDPEVVGAVAALFWSGGWDADGRWSIVDIESFPAVSSLSAIDLQRLARNQSRRPIGCTRAVRIVPDAASPEIDSAVSIERRMPPKKKPTHTPSVSAS